MPSDPGFRVIRVGALTQTEAVARLLDIPQTDPRVRDFIRQCAAELTSLNCLWATQDLTTGRLAHACLASLNPGRTAVLTISPGTLAVPGVSGAHTRAHRIALLEHLCGVLGPPEGRTPEQAGEPAEPEPINLVQSLCEPDEHQLIEAFIAARFQRLADLAYMRRPIPHGPPPRDVLPPGLVVRTLAELQTELGESSAEVLLREALERSYVDTLDCPDLCGMRSLEDVIVSHRAVGQYDPSLWCIVLADQRAVGCILLAGEAGPGTVELVYLGIAPEVRGRGVGSGLLRMGLGLVSRRDESTIACAVDLRNTPALELYRRGGFKRFATRVALVRQLD